MDNRNYFYHNFIKKSKSLYHLRKNIFHKRYLFKVLSLTEYFLDKYFKS